MKLITEYDYENKQLGSKAPYGFFDVVKVFYGIPASISNIQDIQAICVNLVQCYAMRLECMQPRLVCYINCKFYCS